MFPRVNFVPACLWDWDDQAPTKAAAHKDGHDAEVKDHGAMGVHVFGAGDACFRPHWSSFDLMLGGHFGRRVNFDIWIKLNKLNWSTHLRSKSMSPRLNNLGKGCNSILNTWFDLMKLVPKVFLDNTHIFPSVHSVSFNITYFILIFCLLVLITLHIDLQVRFFRTLDNYLSYFLWCFYFVYFYLVFKSLSDNIWERHIINLLRCFHLSIWY